MEWKTEEAKYESHSGFEELYVTLQVTVKIYHTVTCLDKMKNFGDICKSLSHRLANICCCCIAYTSFAFILLVNIQSMQYFLINHLQGGRKTILR